MYGLDYNFPSDALIKRTVFDPSASISHQIQLDNTGGFRGTAVLTPSAWTAANIAFQVSLDGVNWSFLRDKEAELVVIKNVLTGSSALYAAPAELWSAGVFRYFRLASVNDAGDFVNQAAQRVLFVALLK